MPNEEFSDEFVKANILSEYGQSLATVAEALLRYPDVMSRAQSDVERTRIDAQYARVIRRTLASRPIALTVLEEHERVGKRFDLLASVRRLCRFVRSVFAWEVR